MAQAEFALACGYIAEARRFVKLARKNLSRNNKRTRSNQLNSQALLLKRIDLAASEYAKTHKGQKALTGPESQCL